jgi:dTDP-4-amino-4,6-dideoxygalactose transaminase
MTWKVPLFDLNYDEREEQAVVEVIRSRWLTMGQRTQEFEQAFGHYLGNDVSALAVSSCTAALHLSLLAANVRPGDEVVISGLSFIASLNLVTLLGATPVIADAKSLNDWNISPEDIRRKITRKTRAIVLVHFSGYPCDMDAICQIAREHQIVVIEDAAHAVGARYKGRACGTLGDIACFSFFSNKNLSTGEGGMVVTALPELYERVKLLRSHGMTSLTVERHAGKAVSYDVVLPGLNYRIDEIRSAIGLIQLAKLDAANARRRSLMAIYRQELNNSGIIIPWDQKADAGSSCHIAPVLLPTVVDRAKVMEQLKQAGIQTSIHYPNYADFTCYQGLCADTPICTQISRRVLTLPLYPSMDPLKIGFICRELIKHVV